MLVKKSQLVSEVIHYTGGYREDLRTTMGRILLSFGFMQAIEFLPAVVSDLTALSSPCRFDPFLGSLWCRKTVLRRAGAMSFSARSLKGAQDKVWELAQRMSLALQCSSSTWLTPSSPATTVKKTDHVREVNDIMISTRLTNPIHGAVRELVTHDEHSVVELHHLFTFPLVDSTAPRLMVVLAPRSSLVAVIATKHQRGRQGIRQHAVFPT